ncbi:NADH dehydrogenase subunit N [Dongia mobilis]|uniref:NADH-quinone oxidoreductase subunit N n=1 Tax=Dongia mobilis TaxID=578943 RepID=A0A4R6WUD8_9PROT|nr:NADH-quinone oxidoreductase subunit NuoN [Dongia mobilis]TDQ80538.1 NADH dehydrogenase subunit N [Dongia mobilis]
MESFVSLNLGLARPEIFLAVASLALLVLGAWGGDRSTRLIGWASVASLVIAIALTATDGAAGLAFNGLFVADAFAAFAKIVAFGAAAVAIIVALDQMARDGVVRFELPLLMLLASLGMALMISANDLIALYVGLELQSLALYVVAAIRRDTVKSTEAGLKYFVLGALSSGMLLYGSSLIYGFSGSTSFETLAAALAGEPSLGLIVGLVFLCAGLAFKISAVPFHMWTPDVYEGAPTPITAFFAAAPKVAAMALFARVLIGPFGEMDDQWRQIIVVVAVLSMILGAVAAIAQKNIKRLMAYSSIGNVGYALVGLAAGTAAGINGLLLYMAIYVVMTIGAFAVIMAMRRQGQGVEEISDLAGLSQSQRGLAVALAIFMFSMAGIPPLAGFFGKFFVFNAAIAAGLYGLAVIGVLTSVVSAFYYIRIVKVMFFDPATTPFDRVPGTLRAVLIASVVVISFGFLAGGPVIELSTAAADSLFAG